MAETYSQSVTGIPARHATYTVTTLKLGDSTAGTPGAQALAMRTNTPVLCQGPDGAMRYYTIDASRSKPGGPFYMLLV